MNELLVQEVNRRVEEAHATEEYWRLLAWLEQVQPPFNFPEGIFPPFTYQLLLDELNASGSDLRTALRDLASRAIQAEQEHFLAATLDQIDHAGLDLKNQIDDRTDSARHCSRWLGRQPRKRNPPPECRFWKNSPGWYVFLSDWTRLVDPIDRRSEGTGR